VKDKQRTEEVVAGRVRQLRQERDWSQEDLARYMSRAGFSWRQTTVAKTEAASRPLRVDELSGLADVFEVAVGQLLVSEVSDAEKAARNELLVIRTKYHQAVGAIQAADAAVWKAKAEMEDAIRRRDELEAQTKEAELALLRIRSEEHRANQRASEERKRG